jgi:flavin-dependent dehydrogenase
VLLAGDAAGQVKVTTVGGVVAGMRGGLAAARAILDNTFYDAELRPLRQELAFHALVRRVLDGFTDEDYDALLNLLNRPALAVLGRYHRDELARALWRLFLSQPRWLLLGARALVRGFRQPPSATPISGGLAG